MGTGAIACATTRKEGRVLAWLACRRFGGADAAARSVRVVDANVNTVSETIFAFCGCHRLAHVQHKHDANGHGEGSSHLQR